MAGFPAGGGCFCGAVRYKQLAPAMSVQHCHCARCRKFYGMLSAQGAVIRRENIVIESDANLTTFYTSKTFYGQFCKTCGCHLFEYEVSEPTVMYFFPATLDGGRHPGHPAGKECHIYVGSKAEWDNIRDGLPQYETTSPDEIISGIQRGANP